MDPLSLEARVEHSLASKYPGVKLKRYWVLHGGISATTTAFEIELADGSSKTVIARQPTPAFCRAGRDAAREEFAVWSAMADQGLPVQTPIAVETYGDGIERPFFLVEYIDGCVDLKPSDPMDFARKYAEALVKIHQADLTNLSFLPLQSDEIRIRAEPNEDHHESEVVAAMLANQPIHPNNKVLRHGDFWGGNILWRDGEIVGIIDWEECVIGEPLADVSITRLDLWWVLEQCVSDEFTRRYFELMPLDPTDLPFWDLWASRRPGHNLSAWANSFPPLDRPDVTRETMRSDLLDFIKVALSNIR